MADKPIADPIRPMATFAAGLFQGRVAVVTGGGTGIGRETALGFARYGGHVVVAGRTEERLRETAEQVAALRTGAECLVVPTNIRDVAQVERLLEAALERFGKVDYLVNNAGGQFPGLPSQISDNGWRAVIDLNLNGTWNMVSRFMKPMVDAGYGAIVNVVHVFSFERGAPIFVHSGAARAGVVSLTRTMAPYLGYHGVTINALAPGTVATPGMHDNEVGRLGYGEEAWAEKVDEVGPMRRMGSAEEMAAMILFLCSPAARFINGAAIIADGAESRANWVEFFPRGSL
ncbi:MAG: SDR family oxidoreductase [Deltaproteobacteria bacterium]|nr:SDR family oxidoreductase [Deltaproteobacteria bacterium]